MNNTFYTPPTKYKSKGINWLRKDSSLHSSEHETANLVKLQPKLVSLHPNAVESSQNIRKLGRTHKLIRGEQSRDIMPEVFMRIAAKDNRRIAQRDNYRAYREAKKLAKRSS